MRFHSLAYASNSSSEMKQH